jgi:DNA invertase Pin-like site-specific DNA recombinase
VVGYLRISKPTHSPNNKDYSEFNSRSAAITQREMIAQFSEKLDLKLIFKDVGVSSSRSQVERKLDEVRRLLDLYPILIVTKFRGWGDLPWKCLVSLKGC